MEKVPVLVREREAKALTDLYAERTDLTHGAFAKAYGLASAAMVWQYLNNRRALNVTAACQFALGLRVPVTAFSPRLMQEAMVIASAVEHGDQARHVLHTAEVTAEYGAPWPLPSVPRDRWSKLPKTLQTEIDSIARGILIGWEAKR